MTPMARASLLLLALVGCPSSSITPDGGPTQPDASDPFDASGPLDAHPRDASPDGDASPPLPGPDGHISPPLEDGGPLDDADAGEPTCPEDDLAGWTHLLRRLDLVDVLADCAAAPRCGERSCAVADCLRFRAGIEGCESCVSAEISCLHRSCRANCAPSSTSERCRWCLCDAECLGVSGCSHHAACLTCSNDTEACGPHPLDVATMVGSVL